LLRAGVGSITSTEIRFTFCDSDFLREAINEPRGHGGDRKSAAQKSSLQNVNLIAQVNVVDRAAAAWLVKNDRETALAILSGSSKQHRALAAENQRAVVNSTSGPSREMLLRRCLPCRIVGPR